ncbi:hypothetical protein BDV11DRAFT_176141 [Aspergillus similis]
MVLCFVAQKPQWVALTIPGSCIRPKSSQFQKAGVWGSERDEDIRRGNFPTLSTRLDFAHINIFGHLKIECSAEMPSNHFKVLNKGNRRDFLTRHQRDVWCKNPKSVPGESSIANAEASQPTTDVSGPTSPTTRSGAALTRFRDSRLAQGMLCPVASQLPVRADALYPSLPEISGNAREPMVVSGPVNGPGDVVNNGIELSGISLLETFCGEPSVQFAPGYMDLNSSLPSWNIGTETHEEMLRMDLPFIDELPVRAPVEELWFFRLPSAAVHGRYPERDMEPPSGPATGPPSPGPGKSTEIDDHHRRILGKRLQIMPYKPTVPSTVLLNFWIRLYFSRLDDLWRQWASQEELIRLAHGLYIIDAELNNLFHREPLQSFRSYRFSFTASEAVFMAPTAHERKARYLVEMQQRQGYPSSPQPHLISGSLSLQQVPLTSSLAAYTILQGIGMHVLSHRADYSNTPGRSVQGPQPILGEFYQRFVTGQAQACHAPLHLTVLWHAVAMSTLVDFDLLERAVGWESSRFSPADVELTRQWARSEHARSCVGHAPEIKDQMQTINVVSYRCTAIDWTMSSTRNRYRLALNSVRECQSSA